LRAVLERRAGARPRGVGSRGFRHRAALLSALVFLRGARRALRERRRRQRGRRQTLIRTWLNRPRRQDRTRTRHGPGSWVLRRAKSVLVLKKCCPVVRLGSALGSSILPATARETWSSLAVCPQRTCQSQRRPVLGTADSRHGPLPITSLFFSWPRSRVAGAGSGSINHGSYPAELNRSRCADASPTPPGCRLPTARFWNARNQALVGNMACICLKPLRAAPLLDFAGSF
jgi:hypothetical protein